MQTFGLRPPEVGGSVAALHQAYERDATSRSKDRSPDPDDNGQWHQQSVPAPFARKLRSPSTIGNRFPNHERNPVGIGNPKTAGHLSTRIGAVAGPAGGCSIPEVLWQNQDLVSATSSSGEYEVN